MSTNESYVMKASYTTMTPISEPIEVRFVSPNEQYTYVLTAWVDEHGVVRQNIVRNGRDREALSNLAGRMPTVDLPGKAVPGWQAEVLAFAKATGYRVTEVR